MGIGCSAGAGSPTMGPGLQKTGCSGAGASTGVSTSGPILFLSSDT